MVTLVRILTLIWNGPRRLPASLETEWRLVVIRWLGIAFMLPGLSRAQFAAQAAWLEPDYWLAATNRLVFTMQLFVLKARDRIIVLDTGVGNHKQRGAGAMLLWDQRLCKRLAPRDY